ncbi:MAG: ABC transporter substrate-binding protein [Rhodobacteraceae bacterium]|nr:ABC transporter substrate-binding protein [Paracoccaceae bacterium]
MARLDRRALIASGAASALLAASGVALAAPPRHGGHLRIAVARPGDGSVPGLQGAAFETLTEIAPNGVLRDALATDWHVDADACRWRFDLRDDVRFHDGRGFGPRDAVASLRRAGLDARVAGAHRVEVRLERADPDLAIRLADPAHGMLPADGLDAALAQGMGTGMYRVTALRPGRFMRAERVQLHHKAGRAGWADRIEVLVIPDARIRAEALRDGFVDVSEAPDAETLRAAGRFLCHPGPRDMALAAHPRVGMPAVIGARHPLDDGRIAERWWIAG